MNIHWITMLYKKKNQFNSYMLVLWNALSLTRSYYIKSLEVLLHGISKWRVFCRLKEDRWYTNCFFDFFHFHWKPIIYGTCMYMYNKSVLHNILRSGCTSTHILFIYIRFVWNECCLFNEHVNPINLLLNSIHNIDKYLTCSFLISIKLKLNQATAYHTFSVLSSFLNAFQ